MTLSAWRPLEDAPRDKPVVVRGFASASPVEFLAVFRDFWRHSRTGWHIDEWQFEYRELADTYELDRAVQGEIARAFGELIQAMVDGEQCFSMWWTDEIASLHRDQIQQDAIRKVASILHTATGGRIPDEVSK